MSERGEQKKAEQLRKQCRWQVQGTSLQEANWQPAMAVAGAGHKPVGSKLAANNTGRRGKAQACRTQIGSKQYRSQG
eukprot:1149883-Pelagomonas_calceolata.AAC.4